TGARQRARGRAARLRAPHLHGAARAARAARRARRGREVVGLKTAIWHDVECASYEADRDLWLSLATSTGGPILDIGCGTGRVALPLAEAGFDVTGLDTDPDLVRALGARAGAGLDLRAVVADARSFDLGKRFALA